jgi:predicted HD phosphohydrolase
VAALICIRGQNRRKTADRSFAISRRGHLEQVAAIKAHRPGADLVLIWCAWP